MASSTYKLTYFNIRGGVETSRFVFAQAGVKYEDKRVEGEEWQKLKPTTPTGMLPILEVDGVQVPGTGPILRFLAERFGLAGDNDVENLQLASLYDVYYDLIQKLYGMFFEKDEERKALVRKGIENDHVPKYFGILERRYKENNSAGGWIFGNKPTYVDFALFCLLEELVKMFPGLLDPYPGIRKMQAAVGSLPNIAAWIKERPVTDY